MLRHLTSPTRTDTPFPSTTLFRSAWQRGKRDRIIARVRNLDTTTTQPPERQADRQQQRSRERPTLRLAQRRTGAERRQLRTFGWHHPLGLTRDRKSTRLNSSH